MTTELIYAYTRKQAIEDGVLVDLTSLAREAGFRWPFAVTSAVWQCCVKVPSAVPWQDETGRAWDILMLLRVAIKGRPESPVAFDVLVQNEPGDGTTVRLKAVAGPDDDGGPAITVMFPEED